MAMSVFALVASATPGPVNIVGALCGARFGPARALPFVTGATLCFTALLLVFGAGVQIGAAWMSALTKPMTLAGGGYLLWLAWRLARAGEPVRGEAAASVPGFWSGFVIQGLNPKAWIAAVSALTTFVLPLPDPGKALVVFAALFTGICWLSLAAWACGGAGIGLRSFAGFNRAMAALLVASVAWMLWSVASA
ncbi:LysE family translocator [Methylobacterium tarhaniae]|nr:LysE family transporter [Methylobacterium tarhaniae]